MKSLRILIVCMDERLILMSRIMPAKASVSSSSAEAQILSICPEKQNKNKINKAIAILHQESPTYEHIIDFRESDKDNYFF